MKHNKRLCYFITEDWYFCSHRLDLAKAASKKGFGVSVIVRIGKHGEEILNAGLKLLPLDISRRSINPFSELKTIWSVYNYYKHNQPDIVHHVALKPILYGTIAAKLTGVPAIINAFAGLGWLFSSNQLKARILKNIMRFIYKWLLNNTDIIVQNPDDLKVLESIGLKNIHLIRGAGVDINMYDSQPETEDTPLVILPARLLWHKGVGVFVEAAKVLKQEGVRARFALVGEPDVSNPSSVDSVQLEEWKTEGVVEVWGQRSDMEDVYAQSHIVCLPTIYGEGIPKSLIEAAACARPIVTSNAPGCREIVKDNENGYLVDPYNMNELVDRLRKLILNGDLRKKMGERGRVIVEKDFTSEKVIAQTLALYNSVTNNLQPKH